MFKQKNKTEDARNVRSDFQEYVYNGRFQKAYECISNTEYIEIQNQLVEISIRDQNLMPYEFINYILGKNEKASYHTVLANLMITSYNVLPGAYEIALMHTKRAIEIDSECVEAWALIMYLGVHPDSELTIKDMEEAKEKIRKLDPDNPYLKEKFWE